MNNILEREEIGQHYHNCSDSLVDPNLTMDCEIQDNMEIEQPELLYTVSELNRKILQEIMPIIGLGHVDVWGKHFDRYAS